MQKALTSPLMLVAINSPGGKLSADFLTNYAIINVQDQLARVKGVSRVQTFGGQYAMRVWVQPDKLAQLGVTATEVISAIQAQNNVNPAGQIGAEPIPKGQQFTYTVRTQGRLVTPEEFGNIILRANPDGSILHLRDVARIELGDQAYGLSARYNQAPSGVMAIYQLPGSNAVETAAAVKARMKELSATFPSSITYSVPLDTTKAVTAGIREIVYTLLEASGPGRSCGLHLSSRLARNAHSASGCTGFAHRHLHYFSRAWFLDQHAFAVWTGAGHRPGGR